MSNSSERAAAEWEAVVTDSGNVWAVDRLQVGGATTPALPIHHRGHATGAAMVLQRNNNVLTTSSAELAEYPTRVQMFLVPDPRRKTSVAVLETPACPYWSYSVTCAICGQRFSTKGIKLMRAALTVLQAAAEGATYKITLT